jgi:8-oxo-dGTP pyrophosphatase MutT (NUDIX family)
MSTSIPESNKKFRNALPPLRLGTSHPSLEAFREAIYPFAHTKTKEYSLVIVTESSRQRILLGLKQRGFGEGMYNSFGGKVEPDETAVESAARELMEETGIDVSVAEMSKRKVAVHHFTFEDSDTLMLVHVFRLDVVTTDESSSSTSSEAAFWIDPNVIRPCDEIIPQWFEDWHDIPLNNMFADDSLWLTTLLSSKEELFIDGYFHFEPGGQQVNTNRHYYMDIRPKTRTSQNRTLEEQLFHDLHSNQTSTPSIKEFNEGFSFANAVRSFFGKASFDIVIDVAGGHGALAALLLIMTSAREAVVVDPADVGGQGVLKVWGGYLKGGDKKLRYRYECLRTGLPAELDHALLKTSDRRRILVVACHACQHLSDESLSVACRYGVCAAVMPCCQKDTSPGSSWKIMCKSLGLPFATSMDILLAGKAMSWNAGAAADTTYDVRMRTIDKKITPQNRIILCRPNSIEKESEALRRKVKADNKLVGAYRRAHGKEIMSQNNDGGRASKEQRRISMANLMTTNSLSQIGLGITIGVLLSTLYHHRRC